MTKVLVDMPGTSCDAAKRDPNRRSKSCWINREPCSKAAKVRTIKTTKILLDMLEAVLQDGNDETQTDGPGVVGYAVGHPARPSHGRAATRRAYQPELDICCLISITTPL